MNTHTPAPWAVVNGAYPSFKEVSGPSFKISVVMSAIDLTEQDYTKRDADLLLIAAAPELLEFAQRVLIAANKSDSTDPLLDWIADSASAVISKATGAAA